MIDYAKMAKKKRCKVFVSYSRHDEALVKPLAGLLGVAADDAVFLDIDSLKPGDSWESEIEDAVRACVVFVVCWCCESSQSEFVKREITIALEDVKKRLVPVLFCATPLPQPLKKRQWVDLQGRVMHKCNAHRITSSGAKPDFSYERYDSNAEWVGSRRDVPVLPTASSPTRTWLIIAPIVFVLFAVIAVLIHYRAVVAVQIVALILGALLAIALIGLLISRIGLLISRIGLLISRIGFLIGDLRERHRRSEAKVIADRAIAYFQQLKDTPR